MINNSWRAEGQNPGVRGNELAFIWISISCNLSQIHWGSFSLNVCVGFSVLMSGTSGRSILLVNRVNRRMVGRSNRARKIG